MDLNNIERKEEKIILAKKMAQRVKDGEVIGFGSGTTSYLTVIEIANIIKEKGFKIKAIPTSVEIEKLCNSLGIETTTLEKSKIDWCFDGADEVAPNNWLIKGKGAAMFREKINFENSNEIYVLIDDSKKVEKLGEKEPVPVECLPLAVKFVEEELIKNGAVEVILRKKDGEVVVTDNGNNILDVRFKEITENLEKDLKQIVGVIETGLFIGYKVTIIS